MDGEGHPFDRLSERYFACSRARGLCAARADGRCGQFVAAIHHLIRSSEIIGDDGVAQVARQPLIDALAARGLRYTAVRPDRFVEITLADRPRISGTAVAGCALSPA